MGKRVACALCGGKTTRWAQWPGLPMGTTWNLYMCPTDQILTVAGADLTAIHVDQLDFHERKFAPTLESVPGKREDMDRLVDELKWWLGEPGARVDELGAGRAAITAALARRGYEVVSSEPSEQMVATAHADYGLNDLQLRALTATQHLRELPDESTDNIVMWHVLEHVDTPLQVLQEVRRVLRPRGCLVLQMPLVAPEALFAAHAFVVLPRFPEALARLMEMTVAYVAVDLERLFITVVLSREDLGIDDRRPADLPLAGLPGDMAVWLAASRLQDVRWQQEVPE